ncbi:hypothetical protein [Hoeflea sp.]|uniref:hypothetical protein n=1 Tax=Hoeflea sp. TaxID=1940281 RepID=UPI003B526FF2
MATILAFDEARPKSANGAKRSSERSAGPATILMFTGVRREPLKAGTEIPQARRHEPMFDDPLPGKPARRKRRSKNA